MKNWFILLKITLLSMPLLSFGQAEKQDTTAHWRPNFHFSPQKNWINDPNGLVYFQEEYHLFYQYNPLGNKWGNMSWGHAVSKDLITWQELPVAIPQDSVWIFSGSIVIDKDNSSGFQTGNEPCMVAIYTADYHDERKEAQYLAYSNDRGRTWTKYANNPVLDLNMKDFRDPNVIWHKQTQQWIMSVAFPKEYKIVFFRSKNLKNWERLGDFGNQGEMRKIWECPSLIEVPLDSSLTHTKWVLMVSTNGADKDYTGMQYFVGHFNGHTFINEHTPDTKLYVDYGKDFYAAIPFNNLPDKKPIIIGWMNSWQYAEAMPTFPWNGQMSIPRTLTLRTTPEGIRLFQQPVENLKTQNPYNVFEKNDFVFKKEKQLDGITLFSQNTYMVETEFKLKGGKYIGLIIGQKKKQKDSKKTIQETIIGYDVYTKRLYIDRRISGKIIHKDFATIEKAHLKLENKLLKLKVLVDKLSVEVFANDGKIVMTDLIFPADSTAMFSLFSHRGKVAVKTLKITDLSQKPLHKLLLN